MYITLVVFPRENNKIVQQQPKLTVVKKDEGFVHMRDTPKAGMVQIIDYIMIDLQVQKEVVVIRTM